ncbi:913_t:CDS:2, partial [Racocetra persica]
LIINESSSTDSSENLNVEDDKPPKDSPKNTSHHLSLVHIELYCEKTFETWDECQKLGKYISCKTTPPEKQKKKGSKRINCFFLVNVSKIKGYGDEMVIKLNSMHLKHNHSLVPKNVAFATKYQKLTTEIKELIESYTLCNIDVPSQVRLLRGLFSKATIVDYDIKNYIYKFHRNHEIKDGDAAKLLQYFEKERAKDPDCIFAVVDNNFKLQIIAQAVLLDKTSESYRWVLQQTIKATGVQLGVFIIDANPGFESIVLEVYPNTYFLYCVWHIERNLEKQLSKLLGDRYADFLKAFYHAKMFYTKKHLRDIGNIENRPIKIEYDLYQICFEKLLEGIDHSLIAEIWEVHSIENKSSLFHISLISNHWYKDDIVDTLVAAAKVIDRKQSTKGSLLELARKYVELVDYDDPNNPDILIKMFKDTEDDQALEYEQVNNEVSEYDQVLEETESIQVIEYAQASYLEVQNLLRYIKKDQLAKKAN